MRVNEFIANYNLENKKLRSPTIRNTKAIYKDKNEIIIELEFRLFDDSLQMYLIQNSVSDIFIDLVKNLPQGKKLLEEGVNFNLQLYNRNHVQFGEVYLNKDNKRNYERAKDLASVIKKLNESLPITDAKTGIKFVNIGLESKSTVYFEYQIPKEMQDMITIPEMEDILKQDILTNPNTKTILASTNTGKITQLVCVYTDEHGYEIKKVHIQKSEFVYRNQQLRYDEKALRLIYFIKQFNKGLPVTDDKFGFRFLSMEKGQDNEIINKYIVPKEYEIIIEEAEFDRNLKLGLLGSEALYAMISNTEFDIKSINNIYLDRNHKILKKTSMQREDYKQLYTKN